MFSLYPGLQFLCFLFILCYKFHVFALSCVTNFMFSLYLNCVTNFHVFALSCVANFMFWHYPVLQISCFRFILCYKFSCFLFLEAHSSPRATLSKNCLFLGTDHVRRQISEHICARLCAPNGGYCYNYMGLLKQSLFDGTNGGSRNPKIQRSMGTSLVTQ